MGPVGFSRGVHGVEPSLVFLDEANMATSVQSNSVGLMMRPERDPRQNTIPICEPHGVEASRNTTAVSLGLVPLTGGPSESNNALSDHGICDLQESSNVCSEDVIVRAAIFCGCFCCILVDVDHDVVEFFINFLSSP